MGVWYKFWHSRVGSGLLGVFSAYCTWVLFADPMACSPPTHFPHFAVCWIGGAIGNVAASVVMALSCIFFFYLTFRPQRL